MTWLRRHTLTAVACAAVLLLAAAVVVVRCDRATNGTGGRDRPKVFRWDFSTSTSVDVVGWPQSDTRDTKYVDGPAVAEIVLPGGAFRRYEFAVARIYRSGRQVRSVYLLSIPEQATPAYNRASTLIDEWGLEGRDKLQQWYDWRQNDPFGRREGMGVPQMRTSPIANVPRCTVEIRKAYSDDMPWCVSIGIGLLPLPPQPD